jgi:hypothetical protein
MGWLLDFGLHDTSTALATFGSVLMLLGRIIALVGWVWLVSVAYGEGFFWGLGCVFLPFVWIIVTVKFWQEARKAALVLGVGWLLVFGGFVVVVTTASAEDFDGEGGSLRVDAAPPPILGVAKWLNVEVAPPLAEWTKDEDTGSEVRFDALAGRVVVVEVWATWDAPSKDAIETLNLLHDARAAQGLLILALTIGGGDEHLAEVEALVAEKIRYPVGILGWSDSAELYLGDDEEMLPSATVIGRDGLVAWTGRATDPALKKAVAQALSVPPPAGMTFAAAPPPTTTAVEQPGERPVGDVPVTAPDVPAVQDWTDEGYVLSQAGSRDASARFQAVREWTDRLLDRPPGARARMLRALPAPLDKDVAAKLGRSFELAPASIDETIECLALTDGDLHRVLVRQLARRAVEPADADRVAAAFLRLPELERDPLVEESLVRIGHPREGAALRLVKKHGMDWVRSPEGAELLALFPPERLGDLASASEAELRALACRLLGAAPAAAARPHLEALLADSDRVIRQAAIEALGRDPQVAPILVRMISRDADESTRSLARRALEALPAVGAVAELTTLARSPDVADRLAALLGLEVLQRIEAVSPLMTLLHDQDPAVRIGAARALSAFQAARVPGLPEAVATRADELGRLARETQDADLRRALRHLFFTIRGRLP